MLIEINNINTEKNMKKQSIILLLIISLFYSVNINAQMAVVDGGVNAQLIILNKSIGALEMQMSKLNASATKSNIAEDALRYLEENKEEILLKVADYLKTGVEFTSILDREARIITKIKALNQVIAKTKTSNKKIKEQWRSDVKNCLTTTGSLVDLSINLLTDGVYRMDVESRRNYLKEIDGKLGMIEGIVNNMHSTVLIYDRTFNKNK